MSETPEPAPTDGEAALGFTAQTLKYPEECYELPALRSASGVRLERTVALVVDDQNRLRRRPHGRGYLHERFNGWCWEAAAQFETLEDLAQSEVYRRYAAQGAEQPVPPREETGD